MIEAPCVTAPLRSLTPIDQQIVHLSISRVCAALLRNVFLWYFQNKQRAWARSVCWERQCHEPADSATHVVHRGTKLRRFRPGWRHRRKCLQSVHCRGRWRRRRCIPWACCVPAGHVRRWGGRPNAWHVEWRRTGAVVSNEELQTNSASRRQQFGTSSPGDASSLQHRQWRQWKSDQLQSASSWLLAHLIISLASTLISGLTLV